jgi:hypothetical protein
MNTQISKVTIDSFKQSRNYLQIKAINDDKEKINLANKKLDSFYSKVNFRLLNKAATLTIRNRGEMLFEFDGNRPVTLSNKSWRYDIDKYMSKILGLSMEGKGYIYLVSDGEYTKIGATTYNPRKRLNEIQVGNAKKLTLIDSYRAERRISTEKMLHKKYSSKHIRGEWFSLSAIDISEILNNRIQSSNNDEYSLINQDIIDAIGNAGIFLQNDYDEYANKIRLRIHRLTGKGQVWLENRYRKPNQLVKA